MHDDLSTPGRLDSRMTQEENEYRAGVRFFLVSKDGLVACNHCGIHLYHIPELGAASGGDPIVISPQWSWFGNASGYHGTTYGTASPHPTLWLQGDLATHTLEFHVDESGCSPRSRSSRDGR